MGTTRRARPADPGTGPARISQHPREAPPSGRRTETLPPGPGTAPRITQHPTRPPTRPRQEDQNSRRQGKEGADRLNDKLSRAAISSALPSASSWCRSSRTKLTRPIMSRTMTSTIRPKRGLGRRSARQPTPHRIGQSWHVARSRLWSAPRRQCRSKKIHQNGLEHALRCESGEMVGGDMSCVCEQQLPVVEVPAPSRGELRRSSRRRIHGRTIPPMTHRVGSTLPGVTRRART